MLAGGARLLQLRLKRGPDGGPIATRDLLATADAIRAATAAAGTTFVVLVARRDGAVVGYGTYGPFRAWPGYRATVEHSVYVDAACRRGGIEAGNEPSLALHRALGFREVARMPEGRSSGAG